MASVSPISPQASPSHVAGSSLVPPDPSVASVNAFQTAMDSPARAHGASLADNLFGNSSIPAESIAPTTAAPLLDIPNNMEYLPGTLHVLKSVLPSLPNGLPSPMDLLNAQLKVSSLQLEWQFIAKATGTAVQGVQSLVNSQV